MNILYLGTPNAKIFEEIQKKDSLISVQEKLMPNADVLKEKDMVVSFGYRFILSAELIKTFRKKIINLHISYLPWNRGADPNLWSLLEMTPAGVSIHEIDEGIDTGPILCQQEVAHDVENDTLKSSYERLVQEMECLFARNWKNIKNNNICPRIQNPGGSYHNEADKNPFLPLLSDGWNTPVKSLMGMALKCK